MPICSQHSERLSLYMKLPDIKNGVSFSQVSFWSIPLDEQQTVQQLRRTIQFNALNTLCKQNAMSKHVKPIPLLFNEEDFIQLTHRVCRLYTHLPLKKIKLTARWLYQVRQNGVI